MKEIHTATVGLVQKWNQLKQTIEVQPAIMRKREDEDEAKPLGLITDVRVIFPGSGDYWATFDITPGDPVLLIIPERSLDVWLNQGGIVDPKSSRSFSMSDALAIPGVLDDLSIIPGLETLNGGFYIRKKDGTKYIKLGDLGAEVLGDLNVIGNITATGNISTATGDVIAGGVSLKSHTHPTTGTVSNAVPATPGPVTSAGSTGSPV